MGTPHPETNGVADDHVKHPVERDSCSALKGMLAAQNRIRRVN